MTTPISSGFLLNRGWITPRTSGKPLPSGARSVAVRMPWARRDEGQVMILVIGFVVVALALIAVVVSATQVHLERTRLASLADLASLAAAEQVSDATYFASTAPTCGAAGGTVPPSGVADGAGCASVPVPSDDEVAAIVESYLAAHPDVAARWSGLRVVEAAAGDGHTVRVRLAAVVRPAWTAWVLAPFADGIAIGASSVARAW